MKNILISNKLIFDKYNTIGTFYDHQWDNFFKGKKFNLLTLSSRNLNLESFSSLKIKAVILSGGNDLYIFKKNLLNKKRDVIENKLFKICQTNSIPILAVCRGYQFITKKFHGKLIKTNNHVGKNHKINLIENNFLKTKKKKIVVNSFHTYKVLKLPKSFVSIGISEDKSIELSYNPQKKILATMFHPERRNFSNRIIKKLIFNFLDKC